MYYHKYIHANEFNVTLCTELCEYGTILKEVGDQIFSSSFIAL